MFKTLSILLVPFVLIVNLYASTTLGDAYKMALENDPTILALEHETRSMFARVDQAKSQRYPRIQLEGTYNGEFYKRRGVSMDESFLHYGVSLNQPIYKPSIEWGIDKEALRARGAELNYELERQLLATKVAEAYFNVLYAKEAMDLSLSHLETNEVRLRQIETSLQMGLANKMDYLEAQVRVSQSKTELNTQKRKIKLAQLQLARLTGENLEIERDLTNLDIDYLKKVDVNSFEKQLEQNLQLRGAEVKVKVAQKEMGARKTSYLPTLDLRLAYGETDYIDDDMFSDERNKAEIRLNFTIPLYQGGYRKASVRESMELISAEMKRKTNTQKEIGILFEEAANEFEKGIEGFDISQDASHHAQVYVDAIQQGYDEGLKDLVDLLDAKARFYEIQRDKLDATYQIIISYLKMLYFTSDVSITRIKQIDSILGE